MIWFCGTFLVVQKMNFLSTENLLLAFGDSKISEDVPSFVFFPSNFIVVFGHQNRKLRDTGRHPPSEWKEWKLGFSKVLTVHICPRVVGTNQAITFFWKFLRSFNAVHDNFTQDIPYRGMGNIIELYTLTLMTGLNSINMIGRRRRESGDRFAFSSPCVTCRTQLKSCALWTLRPFQGRFWRLIEHFFKPNSAFSESFHIAFISKKMFHSACDAEGSVDGV